MIATPLSARSATGVASRARSVRTSSASAGVRTTLRRPPGHRFLDLVRREVDAGGGPNLSERFESDLGGRSAALERTGPVEAPHLRRERTVAAGDDDLVADFETPAVDDDVADRADPLLVAPLEDRRLAAVRHELELLLEEPLREPDQERDQLRDPAPDLAETGTIPTFRVKSLTRSYRSALNPRLTTSSATA